MTQELTTSWHFFECWYIYFLFNGFLLELKVLGLLWAFRDLHDMQTFKTLQWFRFAHIHISTINLHRGNVRIWCWLIVGLLLKC